MKYYQPHSGEKGQTMLEYLLLLTTVVAIVLVGFKQYLPKFHNSANVYFNRVSYGIYGKPNACGDLCCNDYGTYGIVETCETCPHDCCPDPAFLTAGPSSCPSL